MNDAPPSPEPLTPPPERDVSLQLRARVLNGALATDTDGEQPQPPAGRARLLTPFVVGLAAASVMAAVAIGVSGKDDSDLGPAGTGAHHSYPHVERHRSVPVDKGQLTHDKMRASRDRCQLIKPFPHAGHVLDARSLSVVGTKIPALVYVNLQQGMPGYLKQVYCTPFGVVTAQANKTIATSDDPVRAIAGSQVSALVDLGNEVTADGPVYVEGVWMSLSPGMYAVEVRVNVDGVDGDWYQTRKLTSYVFASGWSTPLSPDSAHTVTTEYRVITADGEVIALDSLGQTVDIPANAPIRDSLKLPR